MTDQPTTRPRTEHYVNKEQWDPYVSERLTADD